MLQIFLLLFCFLSNGKANSIVNVSLKNDSVNQIVTEINHFRTTETNQFSTESNLKIKSAYYKKTLVIEKNTTLINETQQIRNHFNDTSVDKHTSAKAVTADRAHILYRIHATVTRSKDAIWATITLTFMCVLLVLAVAQSKMWKDYNGSESQGVPLPNFNERVLFKDVMERRMTSLKELFKKKKKSVSELESLLPTTEWD